MAKKRKAWHQVIGLDPNKGRFVEATIEKAHAMRIVTEDGKWIELSWDEGKQMFNVHASGQLEVVHNVANDFYVKVR